MSFDLELVNSDLRVKSDGTIGIIRNTPKLRQDIIKVILTPLGSNKFHRWYGCTISEDVTGKNLPANFLDHQIKTSVSEALDRLKALQLAQSGYQNVSPAESIAHIGDIVAGRDISDRRQVSVIVHVFTKQMTDVAEYFTIIS